MVTADYGRIIMHSKGYRVSFLVTLLFISAIVGGLHFVSAQTGTTVGGTISSDRTWTKTGSPYYLTDDITIQRGVTLTIESGVEVNFMQDIPTHDSFGRPTDEFLFHNLEVDGTLIAIGQSAPITFNYGNQITFGSLSSASVIRNVDFNGVNYGSTSYTGYRIQIFDSSLTLDGNSFNDPYPSSQININGGTPKIQNNYLSSITGITATNSAAQILNNTVKTRIAQNLPSNPINSFISLNNCSAIIADNTVSAYYTTASIIITSGSPLIARNFINNYNDHFAHSTPNIGVTISGDAKPVIENNTFAQNDIALNIYDSSDSPMPLIENNNFEQNSQYSIYLGQQGTFGTTAGNIYALNNWWGTTDASVIGQTIYDHKNNNNLGTVTFNPILTSENKNAFPNANPASPLTMPTITPSSGTPTPSTSSYTSTAPVRDESAIPQMWLYGIIIVLIAAIAALSFAFLSYRHRMTTQAQK